jgi:hypothetical protein
LPENVYFDTERNSYKTLINDKVMMSADDTFDI